MRRLWPVIHVLDCAQARANAEIAWEAGAYGVFLIHMDGRDDLLDPIARRIREDHPGWNIGVNYLSMEPWPALQRALLNGYSATWSDRPGVRSDGVAPQAHAIANALSVHPAHRFFASVAFKYQPIDPQPGRAAKAAAELGMVATTSGVATGVAAPLEKLAAMRKELDAQAPLALASGITPENVADVLPYVTDVLVATGVSADFHRLDAKRLADLALRMGIDPRVT